MLLNLTDASGIDLIRYYVKPSKKIPDTAMPSINLVLMTFDVQEVKATAVSNVTILPKPPIASRYRKRKDMNIMPPFLLCHRLVSTSSHHEMNFAKEEYGFHTRVFLVAEEKMGTRDVMHPSIYEPMADAAFALYYALYYALY